MPVELRIYWKDIFFLFEEYFKDIVNFFIFSKIALLFHINYSV